MRILALDPSSVAVGYCLGDDRADLPEMSGVFKPKGKPPERLRQIWVWLRAVVLENNPDMISYEEPAGHHGNFRTDRLLANVTGIIMAIAFEAKIWDLIRVYPMQVKATKCSKDNLIYAARIAGKLEVDGDEADAVGVWLAATAKTRELRMQGRIK